MASTSSSCHSTQTEQEDLIRPTSYFLLSRQGVGQKEAVWDEKTNVEGGEIGKDMSNHRLGFCFSFLTQVWDKKKNVRMYRWMR